MAVAVCVFCGERKAGPMITCKHCGRTPHGSEESSKSIMLSRKFINEKGLETVAGMLKQGQDPFQVPKVRQHYEKLLPRLEQMTQEHSERESETLDKQHDEVVVTPPQVEANVEGDRVPCPYCGEMIAPRAKKCRYCNEWLVEKTDAGSTIAATPEPVDYDDAEKVPARPPSVRSGVRLLYISLGLGLVSGAALAVQQSLAVLAFLIPVLLVTWIVIRKIAAGRNWARVLYLILFGLGAPYSIAVAYQSPPSPYTASIVAQLALQALALFYLFKPASGRWFHNDRDTRYALLGAGVVGSVVMGCALLVVITTNVNEARARQRRAAFFIDSRVLAIALEAYNVDHNGYPNSLNSLVPGYIKELPTDPYTGTDYRYYSDISGHGWAIVSAGPDGRVDIEFPSDLKTVREQLASNDQAQAELQYVVRSADNGNFDYVRAFLPEVAEGDSTAKIDSSDAVQNAQQSEDVYVSDGSSEEQGKDQAETLFPVSDEEQMLSLLKKDSPVYKDLRRRVFLKPDPNQDQSFMTTAPGMWRASELPPYVKEHGWWFWVRSQNSDGTLGGVLRNDRHMRILLENVGIITKLAKEHIRATAYDPASVCFAGEDIDLEAYWNRYMEGKITEIPDSEPFEADEHFPFMATQFNHFPEFKPYEGDVCLRVEFRSSDETGKQRVRDVIVVVDRNLEFVKAVFATPDRRMPTQEGSYSKDASGNIIFVEDGAWLDVGPELTLDGKPFRKPIRHPADLY